MDKEGVEESVFSDAAVLGIATPAAVTSGVSFVSVDDWVTPSPDIDDTPAMVILVRPAVFSSVVNSPLKTAFVIDLAIVVDNVDELDEVGLGDNAFSPKTNLVFTRSAGNDNCCAIDLSDRLLLVWMSW